MYQYNLYGQNISSSLEFPQLIINSENNNFDIVILEGEIPSKILKKAEEKYYEIDKIQSWFQNDTGIFYVSKGREIHYQLKENANLQYARTYILGYAISMLLLQRNILTIHCSAIANNEGAVLIAGESGAGKSTITTSFLNKGYKLLADDIAAVTVDEEGKVLAYPAFPYQKLCRDGVKREKININGLLCIDEEKDKFLVPRGEQFINQPMIVKAMVILGVNDGAGISVDEEVGVNKLFAIRENLFLRRLRGDWLARPEIIQTCLEIGSKVPIYTIIRPRKFDTRSAVINSLEPMLKTL
ncbi:MAG: hypothetical protein Q4F05_03855 [bacterium]|nr:hypothetical protein [bacterium]